MSKNIKLSVVIPVYNEREGLSGVVKAIQDALGKQGHEVIVVDDGSTDGAASGLKGPGISVLRHPYNRGYGAALKTGIRQARGVWILISDGDGSYPSSAVPGLLKETARYDMVVGARTLSQPSGTMGRRIAKFFLKKLANFVTGRKIPDLNSGLRVFRRRDAMRFFNILPDGFSFTTTITLSYLCSDRTVGYMPIHYEKRKGSSKIRPVRDAFNFFLLILRTAMYFNPLKVFMALSAVLFLAGCSEAFFYLTLSHSISKSTVLLLLTALVVASLGLLADLIIKRLPLEPVERKER